MFDRDQINILCASHTGYSMLKLGNFFFFILTLILPLLLNMAEWNTTQFDVFGRI